MADPLSQLRQFHINGKEIKEHNGYIIFGDHGWPKNVNTNYLTYSSGGSGKKEYYTLECLRYFLKNADVAHVHYVKMAGRDNVQVVNRPDRKNILAYLQGDQQTSPGIDNKAPIPPLRLPISEIYKKNSHTSTEQSSSSGAHSSEGQTGANGFENALNKRPHDPEVDRLREAFAARLDESSSKKPATITTTETSDNRNETTEGSAITELGAEKLAAMRAKRMAVKRTTIVDADLEGGLAGPVSGGVPQDLLIAMDSYPIQSIKSKEKVWRTRSTILQAQSKNFAKTILPIAQLMSKPDEAPSRSHHHQVPQVPEDLQQQMPRSSYSRYDQERFVKLDIGVEIDTKKSFVSGITGSNNNNPENNPAKQVPRPVKRPLKRVSRVPIIIIPATTTSIINMYNATALLQDLTYKEGSARQSEVLIQRRKSDGTHAAYKVMDNPVKLDPEDWNRVVAVFVQGPAWQFKGWPWGGSPFEIFARIKGFHLKWDETKLDDNVAKWNVDILELSRSKRHLDKANLLKFWSSLDAYMVKFKSFLKF